jgi:hypothetical protein
MNHGKETYKSWLLLLLSFDLHISRVSRRLAWGCGRERRCMAMIYGCGGNSIWDFTAACLRANLSARLMKEKERAHEM